jgi:alanyl-tRNA synthetase
MSERLYYHDSFLYEFDAEVLQVVPASGTDSRSAIILDRTAFYPTSGGQVFDTGWILPAETTGTDHRIRVAEVSEREQGAVLHFLESSGDLRAGSRIRGVIDAGRRRDHMQQHSGQHVLSAAFVRLFNLPTVSFHMGADYCSIDLDTKDLATEQIEAAEALANDVAMQNRPVEIRFVTEEEARGLGLRKPPPMQREKLRVIDIQEFDLSACGGTHVRNTGQIGCTLLRKAEKVRQGWRIEFVCGKRAVAVARRDYVGLAKSAGMLSSHLGEVPQQIRKLQEEARASRKVREQLLEEIAGLYASSLLAETPENGGRKIIVRVFADRDSAFTKLLAQRLTRQGSNVVALLATTSAAPGLVFAQSAGLPFDMGALLKEALAKLGGRGGGSKDMARGGAPGADGLEAALAEAAALLGR